MSQGPWDSETTKTLQIELIQTNQNLDRLTQLLAELREGQKDLLEELKNGFSDLEKSQINTSKTVSNLGAPIWILTFLGIAAFWKLGWAHEFWYALARFF